MCRRKGNQWLKNRERPGKGLKANSVEGSQRTPFLGNLQIWLPWRHFILPFAALEVNFNSTTISLISCRPPHHSFHILKASLPSLSPISLFKLKTAFISASVRLVPSASLSKWKKLNSCPHHHVSSAFDNLQMGLSSSSSSALVFCSGALSS